MCALVAAYAPRIWRAGFPIVMREAFGTFIDEGTKLHSHNGRLGRIRYPELLAAPCSTESALVKAKSPTRRGI
jgi:hypothetical protein